MKCTVTLAERAFAVKKTMKDMHALHKINECERFFFTSNMLTGYMMDVNKQLLMFNRKESNVLTKIPARASIAVVYERIPSVPCPRQ